MYWYNNELLGRLMYTGIIWLLAMWLLCTCSGIVYCVCLLFHAGLCSSSQGRRTLGNWTTRSCHDSVELDHPYTRFNYDSLYLCITLMYIKAFVVSFSKEYMSGVISNNLFMFE